MIENREPPWMCTGCGYVMDSYSTIDSSKVKPKDGSISICLNCGARYERHGPQWLPLAPATYDAFSPQEKAELARIEDLRRAVIRKDLAGGGRRSS